MMGKKLLVITGQTATGKTSFALEQAHIHNGNLINADSRQIYRDLTLISGKDIEDVNFHRAYTQDGYTVGYYTIQHVPVWLYDIIDPHQPFSSHEYVVLATKVIKSLLEQGITPVIVGGTYLYVYHLLYGLDKTVGRNTEFRKSLQDKSVEELQGLLHEKDQETYNNLNHSDQHNPHRLIRKLEQLESGFKMTGMPSTFTFTLPTVLNMPDLEIEFYGLYIADKELLRERIYKRVLQRVNGGAVEEAHRISSSGYTGREPGLKTLGFTLLSDYIRNTITKESLIEQWVNKELQYAKRQYSFMKRDPHIKWIYPA